MTNPNHRRPSSIKLREELNESRARTKKRWDTDRSSTELVVPQSPLDKLSTKDKFVWLGSSLAALAGVSFTLLSATPKHDTPVDPLTLPGDQVARIYVQPSGSHYVEGIAGKLVNNDTDVSVVAEEIEKEAYGAHTVQTGVELVLPKDQLDPKAVAAYERGE